MDPASCERLKRLSAELCGNNVLLPVAAAIATADADGQRCITGPRVSRTLGGQLPANRVGESLRRLCRMGVLREIPWLGRPHPREYEMVPGPFWELVRAWAGDPEADVSVVGD